MYGRAGLGTDFCAMSVREHLASAKRRGQPAGAIFFDLVAAFYRVVRQLVVGCACGDYDIAELFRRLDLPPSTYQEFVASLAEPPLISAGNESETIARDELQHLVYNGKLRRR